MTHRFPIALILLVLLSLFLLANRGSFAQEESARTPVIVELFTSEGCSSCPPADALLARLHQTQPVPGAEIVALEEHVDYWNRLGWADPYSSADLTARQYRYAESFGNNTVYTPQMVVDGREEFTGSMEARARQAIARAAQERKGRVLLALGEGPGGEDALRLRVTLELPPERTRGEAAAVLLAITEDNLRTDVPRGENAGRSLVHQAVVRSLRIIGRIEPGAAGAFAAEPALSLAPAWKRADLRAVVFVQEEKSRRTLAAASLPLFARTSR